MINRFEKNALKLIEKTKKTRSITHLFGPYSIDPRENMPKRPALWSDNAWQYRERNGKTVNAYFTIRIGRMNRFANANERQRLPELSVGLLQCYALHVFRQSVSPPHKRDLIGCARLLLSETSILTSVDTDVFAKWAEGANRNDSTTGRCNTFIDWLQQHKCLSPHMKKGKINWTQRTGQEALANRDKKLPEEKCILALGAIGHDAIPYDTDKWRTHPLDMQRDAFVFAMGALAMSSPNRAVAEQTVLVQSTLQSHTEVKNGEEGTVHWFPWSGSKGFDDNKNHILAPMKPVVERVLEYMDIVTAPNRVLARFYTNPDLPLKTILGTFNIDGEKWAKVNPDIDKPINLFTLGWLIGLYDGSDEKVRVAASTKGAEKVRSGTRTIYFKALSELRLDDVLVINKYTFGPLFSMKQSTVHEAIYGSIGEYSVREMQAKWLEHLKTLYPDFPTLYNHTKAGQCQADTRMFALSGRQLGVTAGIKGGTSPFMPISPSAMGETFEQEIGRGGASRLSIFMRYGFSSDFRITPHQFRHYLNDVGDKNGISHIVLNMWSGRKDPRQIVHYVHSTQDDMAEVISDLLYGEASDPETLKNDIKTVSVDKYNEVYEQQIASVTSSGVCTQNLIVMPCQFLNDFNVHCVLCRKSCHVAHDQDAIALMKKDMTAQISRLNALKASDDLHVSEAKREWFKLHLKNTDIYKQLILLMQDEAIEKGSLIRVLVDKNVFRVTNLDTKQVTEKPLLLPDIDKALATIINRAQAEPDDTIEKLLELF